MSWGGGGGGGGGGGCGCGWWCNPDRFSTFMFRELSPFLKCGELSCQK